MQKNEKSKTASLIISILVISLSCLPLETIGIYSGAPVYHRLCYTFIHVSVIHAVVNSWCLLSLVFIYDISLLKLIFAYLIASSFPADTLYIIDKTLSIPTVGMSGMCYAITGMLSFSVNRKLFFMFWVSSSIIIGAFLPGVNAIIHLYCYLAGAVYGALNTPYCNAKRD